MMRLVDVTQPSATSTLLLSRLSSVVDTVTKSEIRTFYHPPIMPATTTTADAKLQDGVSTSQSRSDECEYCGKVIARYISLPFPYTSDQQYCSLYTSYLNYKYNYDDKKKAENIDFQ